MREPAEEGTARTGLSRRALLGVFGAGAATAAGIGAAGVALAREAGEAPAGDRRFDFFGAHQAGITTPMQNNLYFAAVDVTTDSREDLIDLLRQWTEAAAAMTQGREIGALGALGGSYDAAPEDTGEALGLPASGLTVTIGFGPTLFGDQRGRDRFGIAADRPPGLRELPHFPGDMTNPAISGGDLCIQACADDAQVAVHAVRNLIRIGFGRTTVRWSQAGFGKSSVTSPADATPRNLFGFKDGTANITGDPADTDRFLWVAPTDDPAWMAGGTYLAVRKIRMTIETWDRTSLREQEAVFGRSKREGSPLSGGGEFDTPDFTMAGSDGQPLIAADSHMALAHPSANDGQRILRRAYNYTDGSDGLGRLDAGLFFLAFQRDLDKQFIPLQMRLSKSDLMNEYVRYLSSSVFAVPPGGQSGGYWGQSLFDL